MHMAQLMPLPLTVSCSSKIQIGFTFLVPAYPGYPGKEAVKWLYVVGKTPRNDKSSPFNSTHLVVLYPQNDDRIPVTMLMFLLM